MPSRQLAEPFDCAQGRLAALRTWIGKSVENKWYAGAVSE
jgi:hypothetical protein